MYCGNMIKTISSYSCWSAMIQRCTNPKRESWKWYGARGIKVCDRWRIFKNFDKDVGPRPFGTSLDRIDPNGNYEKKNCRWATPKQQSETKLRPVNTHCKNCDAPCRGQSRRGICHACNEYFRRNGYSRPKDPAEVKRLFIEKSRNQKTKKPVIGIDENGNIEKFESTSFAIKKYGKGVSNVLAGRCNTAKGRIWKYA